MGVEHGFRLERLFDRLEPRRAAEDSRRAAGQRNVPVTPDRLGTVEPGLAARPPALQRRIHGHAHDTGQQDDVLIGLEPRAEGPFHLPFIFDIDSLVIHPYMFAPVNRTQ